MKRVAELISLILHPFWVIPITLGLLLRQDTLPAATAVFWGILSITLVIGPVAIGLIIGRLTGTYPDWDVHNKELRYGLFRIGGVSIGILLIAVHLFQAPPLFRAMAVAGVLSLAGAWLITKRTKISLHTLIISAAATAVSLSGVPFYIVIIAFTLTFTLAIARIVADAHTLLQVCLGFALGCSTVLFVFWLYLP